MIILFFCFSLIILLLSLKAKLSKINAGLFVGLYFLNAVAFFIYYVSDMVTGNGIDESVVYTVFSNLKGTGFSEYYDKLIISIVILLALIVVGFLLFKVLVSDKKIKYRKNNYIIFVILLLAIFFNPAISNVYGLYFKHYKIGAINAEKSVIIPEINKDYIPPIRKNIIYLYLESLEYTYFDEAIFPGLVPNLRSIQQSSTTFTNIVSHPGTTWTLGGMIGSQCGIPLTIHTSTGNSLAGLEQFLPNAICLGDILLSKGYDLNYLGGADSDFSGKGTFYKNHGFHNVEGLNELRPLLKNPDNLSAWGIYDDELYSLLLTRYKELSKTGNPFGLFSINLDTHHPSGHISERCTDVKYLDGTNPMLNAVHCTDMLIGELFHNITTDPNFKDTIIVIGSDHPAMKNTAYDLLSKGDRSNLLLIYDQNNESQIITRAGSTFDISATLLPILGIKQESIGLGRNLLNNNLSNLTEDFRPSEIIPYLFNVQKIIDKYWDFPQLNDGFVFFESEKILKIGDKKIHYPAIFYLDENNTVINIRFDFKSSARIFDEIFYLEPNQKFVWIDSCDTQQFLNNDIPVLDQSWCMAVGSLDSNVRRLQLSDNNKISAQDIFSLNNSKSVYNKRKLDYKNIKLFGELAPKIETLNLSTLGVEPTVPFYIISQGGFMNPTRYIDTKNASIPLFRGITLLGRDLYTKEIVKLSHLDTCDLNNPLVDGTPFEGEQSFISVIEKVKQKHIRRYLRL